MEILCASLVWHMYMDGILLLHTYTCTLVLCCLFETVWKLAKVQCYLRVSRLKVQKLRDQSEKEGYGVATELVRTEYAQIRTAGGGGENIGLKWCKIDFRGVFLEKKTLIFFTPLGPYQVRIFTWGSPLRHGNPRSHVMVILVPD